MARRVYHLRSHDDPQHKTLCGRSITYRYNFTSVESVNGPNSVYREHLCSRCRARAEREGLILPEGINPDGSVNHENISSGDKQHDDWLSRLGVC